LPSVAELVRSLRADGSRLRDDVIAAVATNETTFFRDVHPFDALRDMAIPDALAANGGRRRDGARGNVPDRRRGRRRRSLRSQADRTEPDRHVSRASIGACEISPSTAPCGRW